jgi:hypothetical protein
MCARGVLAVPGAALTMIPFRPRGHLLFLLEAVTGPLNIPYEVKKHASDAPAGPAPQSGTRSRCYEPEWTWKLHCYHLTGNFYWQAKEPLPEET